jgi:Zn-dependent metalloprotease
VDVQSTNSTSLSTIQANRTAASRTFQNKQTTAISEQDLQQLRQLKSRDLVVRAHEAAHLAAASGIVVGGTSYSYQRGPDGVQYAIGGEVSIDTSKVAGDPNATLQKAQQIQAAALAPTQPSSQDRTVAARAAKMAIEAKAEISLQVIYNNVSPTNQSSPGDASRSLGNTIDISA